MMVAPYKPMMIIPCGHNICEMCLKRNPLTRCPMCKTIVQTTSPNFSLMSLITKFSEAQTKDIKHNEKVKSGKIATCDLELLKMRCDILQKERNQVRQNYQKEVRQVEVLEAVSGKLFEEKIRINKEKEALEEEERLLTKYVEEN